MEISKNRYGQLDAKDSIELNVTNHKIFILIKSFFSEFTSTIHINNDISEY